MQPPVTRRRASPASELLLSSYFTGIPPRKLLGRDLKSPSPLKGHLSRHSGCGRPDPEEDPGGSSRASWDSPNQVSGTNLRNDCLRSRRCQAHTPTREAGREMRAEKGLCPGETPEIPPVGGPEEHRVPRVPVLGRGRRSHRLLPSPEATLGALNGLPSASRQPHSHLRSSRHRPPAPLTRSAPHGGRRKVP